MKKIFLLFLLVSVFSLYGCTNKPSLTENDVMGFLLNLEDVYCNQKVLLNDYMMGSSQDWYKGLIVNGNDVPAQRVLTQKIINDRLSYNIENKIYILNKSLLSGYFYETLRYLNLSNDFTIEFLNKNKDLTSYQEFTEIMPLMGSAIQSLQSISSSLSWEFSRFESSDDYVESNLYSSLLYMDDICSLKMGY